MMILKIKQRGLMLQIPGVAPFRTPAKVDINNSKLHLIVSALKNSGVEDFEIYSKEENMTYTKKDFEIRKKEKEDSSEIEERFDRIEKMLGKLTHKNKSNKKIPEEQITNKLNLIEKLVNKILERETVREIVYTSTKDKAELPAVEELDEDTFIPQIDISEMKLRGSSSEIIDTLDDIDEAANALSQLKG